MTNMGGFIFAKLGSVLEKAKALEGAALESEFACGDADDELQICLSLQKNLEPTSDPLNQKAQKIISKGAGV